MEYIELDCSNRQGCSGDIHLKERSRDWFIRDNFADANDNSDLMEISPPSSNKTDYRPEHVRRVSHSQYHHQKQQPHCGQHKTLGLGIEGQICNIEREHMFEKVVTPSDVGKLNRLVIPKQHAEKYFPLDSSSSDQKGLLNFDDVSGKTWRFRYSYWSSSQSYVMTKGWSRFVKEKQLDAGDIVSFQRGVGEAEKHRLFIDWRRRPISTLPIDAYHTHFYRSAGAGFPSWSPLMFRPPPTQVHPRINFQIQSNESSHYYSGYGGGNCMGQVVSDINCSVVCLTSPEIGMLQGRALSGAVKERIPVVFESVPIVHGKKVGAAASAKKLRLFGVNIDCPISSDMSTSDEFELLSTPAFPVNSLPTSYLSQYSSSSTMLLPSSTRKICNRTPIFRQG